MRYLIDTNILVWLTHETAKIPERILRDLYNPQNEMVISIVSLWEMAIKNSLEKLNINPIFFERIHTMDSTILPLHIEHIRKTLTLPRHHRDPFDRMLIAQAQYENLTIVTSDRKLTSYDAKIMLA